MTEGKSYFLPTFASVNFLDRRKVQKTFFVFPSKNHFQTGQPLTKCPSLTTETFFKGKSGFWSSHLEIDETEVELELTSQIEKFTELVGSKPAYIDGHQHIQASRRVLPSLGFSLLKILFSPLALKSNPIESSQNYDQVRY